MRKLVKVASLLMVMVVLFALTGCYFKAPTVDKFKSSLGEVVNANPSDIIYAEYKSGTAPIANCQKIVKYYGRGISCTYLEFEEDKQAQSYFDGYYENFEDLVEDGIYSGKYKKSSSGSRGYVYFDGTIQNVAASMTRFGVGNAYGGVYYQGNVVVVVITHNGASARSYVGNLLNELGLPKI